MTQPTPPASHNPDEAYEPHLVRVTAGEDRFGEHRGLGISTIDFNIIPQDPALWRAHGMELLSPPLSVE
jgi:hypothetical protein